VVQKELKKLTKEVIASLTGWEFILAAISVAGLWKIGIRSFLTDGSSQIYTDNMLIVDEVLPNLELTSRRIFEEAELID
jgi:hypothetical protein